MPNHPPEAVIMNSIDEAENEDERDIDELDIMSKLQLLAVSGNEKNKQALPPEKQLDFQKPLRFNVRQDEV